MTVSERYRNPWSSSEINKVCNEYEVKNLPIAEIAKLHKRGEYAILHMLAKEGVILESWADVKGWSFEKHRVKFQDDAVSLDDNDDPNDEDYVYESDEDDEDYSVVDSDEEEEEEEEEEDADDCDSDSDYEEEKDDDASVDSDSDYVDDEEDEEFDPHSIKQKAHFLNQITEALKFFVFAA